MDATPRSCFSAWGDAPDGVFDRLAGVWELNRAVHGVATMMGTAEFQRLEAGRLKYREDAQVHLANGRVLRGHREYLFERGPAGFRVFFAEDPPRLFHAIRLDWEDRALAGTAQHLCAADFYRSAYSFRMDGTFSILHAVKGPRKDYLSRTTFTPRIA